MSAPLWAAQDAVYDLLLAAPSLQTFIGAPARLFDHAPQEAVFPYVTLGDVEARAFDTKDRAGLVQELSLHVWSRYRGRKEVKEIAAALYTLLHRATFAVGAALLVRCDLQRLEVRQEKDGLTYHGRLVFRLVTQAV